MVSHKASGLIDQFLGIDPKPSLSIEVSSLLELSLMSHDGLWRSPVAAMVYVNIGGVDVEILKPLLAKLIHDDMIYNDDRYV